jgi:LysR family transcriptional regulator, transcriptional activator of nhaA
MEWLNYHHLLYFWLVVREGGVAKAAAKLRLAHPTVSGQIRALEKALGEQLLVKQGRRLVLTEMGTVVYHYADEIFTLGRELLDTVKGRPTGRPLRLVVGIAEVVPKLIARALLEPVRTRSSKILMVCREDKVDRLITDLASHTLDVVISDSPLPAGSSVRAFNHLFGECSVTVFGRKDLASKYKKNFPRSLDGAPMLLPTPTTALRRSLDQYFDGAGIRPSVEAEFDDSALLEVFGQDGAGLFAASTPLEDRIRHQYDVEPLGRLPEVRERFYAISIERKIRHPAVAVIWQAAREGIFKQPE